MAMDLGGAKGGVKSDINVTPLVDVMLVLLIIMMLIAPMLQQGEGELATKVTELLENSKDKVVLIKADEEVEYSAVMSAMDQLRQAGIEDIGLITERTKGQSAGGK
jgi:biopolymer transport protein TolR